MASGCALLPLPLEFIMQAVAALTPFRTGSHAQPRTLVGTWLLSLDSWLKPTSRRSQGVAGNDA